MQPLEVDAGLDHDAIYRAIYGAAKYYIQSDSNPHDLSAYLYKWFSTKEETPTEAEFIKGFRKFISERIRYYYGNSPEPLTLEQIYKDEAKYKEAGLDKLFFTNHATFQSAYGPNGEGNFQNSIDKFYIELGKKVKEVNSPISTIEKAALYTALSSGANINIVDKKPTAAELNASKITLYITSVGKGYHFFTLTDEKDVKIGRSIVLKPNTSGADAKNAQPVYDFNKIYDAVDYHALGANRYRQFLSKHQIESAVYKNKNESTRLTNIKMSISKTESSLSLKMDRQSIDFNINTTKLFIQINETNIKNTQLLIEKTQEADDQIMLFLRESMTRLTHVAQQNVKTLLLEVHRGLETQKFNMRLLALDAEDRQSVNHLTTLKNMRETQTKIDAALHKLREGQTEGLGQTINNLLRVTGQIKSVTKIGETTKPLLASMAKEMSADFVKATAVFDALKADLGKEITERKHQDGVLTELVTTLEQKTGATFVNLEGRLRNQFTAQDAVLAQLRATNEAQAASISAILQRVGQTEATLTAHTASITALQAQISGLQPTTLGVTQEQLNGIHTALQGSIAAGVALAQAATAAAGTAASQATAAAAAGQEATRVAMAASSAAQAASSAAQAASSTAQAATAAGQAATAAAKVAEQSVTEAGNAYRAAKAAADAEIAGLRTQLTAAIGKKDGEINDLKHRYNHHLDATRKIMESLRSLGGYISPGQLYIDNRGFVDASGRPLTSSTDAVIAQLAMPTAAPGTYITGLGPNDDEAF